MGKSSDVTLSFKTFSKDGLLFLSEKGKNFLSIEIREGRILYQVQIFFLRYISNYFITVLEFSGQTNNE